MNDCLFSEVQDKGIVRDVVVKNARIEINDQEFTGCKGVIACKSSGHSLLKNNTVEDSHVKLVRGGEGVKLGMLAGEISDHAKLEDNQVRNSTMSADASLFARVGILNGEARGAASLESNSIDGCRITAGHNSTDAEMFTGLMAGQILNGVTVRNSRLTNNQLADNTANIHAGGIAGFAQGATIEGTHAINNTLLAHMDDAHGLIIAIVVGEALKCRISDTTATNNYLRSKGRPSIDSLKINGAYTGIVTADCYLSTIKNTLAEHSQLYSRGQAGVATAHVSSGCEIHNTTARNMIIEASPIADGEHAAAIAAGHIANSPKSNKISQTTAIGCQISANGTKGYAAVGAGLIKGSVIISDTTACNSTIKGDHVGIATGSTDLPSTRTYACNTKLNTLPDNSGCAEANCLQDPQESIDVPPTRLTTTAGGNQTTTDVLYPHPETLVNSTATKTATLSSSRPASAPASSPTLTTSELSSSAVSPATSSIAQPASSVTLTPVLSSSHQESAGTSSSASAMSESTGLTPSSMPSSALSSSPASTAMLTTDVTTTAYSGQATTELLSSPLATPVNSTATPIATGSPDSPNFPPSAKTSFPVSPSSSQLTSPMASSPTPTTSELTSSATPSPVLSRSSSPQERTLTTSLSPTTSELASSATLTSVLSSSHQGSSITSSSASAISESTGLTPSSMPSSAQSSSLTSTALLTTKSSDVSTTAYSDQSTTEFLSSPLSSPVNSTATPIATGSPDSPNFTPSAKTSLPVSPSSSQLKSTPISPSSTFSPSASSAMPSSSASSSQLTSPMAFSPSLTVSQSASSATPAAKLSSSQVENAVISSSSPIIPELTSSATPSSSLSSSQLPSSPASSSTQTTSESSSSAVAPATFP
ncbi:hypothetical protein, partial [Endozoicomonas sp. SESOKO1]|uniref:hypothetical protein n=1 Tax=Endozoicomonas sp. SESOKO1 TaxID=2828742 RepID=UPI0021473437